MLSLLLLLLGCATPYPGACTSYARLYCDTCEMDDAEKVACTCIENGTLVAGDFPGDIDITDDEAAGQCDEVLFQLKYPSPDGSAACKQALVVMQDHEQEVCDDYGLF